MSFEEALEFTRTKKKNISPNSNFVKQLKELSK